MKKVNSCFWGIIIAIVGVLFLGNTFEWWSVDIFFNGWWTLFIIIPSIYGLVNKEITSSLLGLAIGILLFLAAQSFIEWKAVGQAFIPIMLIIIGLTMALKPKNKVKLNSKGLPEYIGVFSGTSEKVNDTFKGANLVSVFGSVELDLTKAKIKEDIILECVTIFGGIDIKVPDDVKVKTSGVPIFGGLENKSSSNTGPKVIINYVAIFGGIDVK